MINTKKDIYSERSIEIFNSDVAARYPKKAIGEKYSLYKENILYGSSRLDKNVLELCCGVGKYFHCIDHNVNSLSCVDISPNMLTQARINILENHYHLRHKVSFYEADVESFLPNGKFDFIFCIGAMAEYCVFDNKILEKILQHLNRKGFLFLTLVDVDTDYVRKESEYDWSPLFLSRKNLDDILHVCHFNIHYTILSHHDNKHLHHILKLWKL